MIVSPRDGGSGMRNLAMESINLSGLLHLHCIEERVTQNVAYWLSMLAVAVVDGLSACFKSMDFRWKVWIPRRKWSGRLVSRNLMLSIT